jgi:hypothetical protein
VGKARTPPWPDWPEWSEAKFWAFLRSGLRAKWTRWPPKYAVVAAAKRPYVGDNKRQKFEYQCAACSNYYPQKEVSVDHIVPVGTLKSFDDLPAFVQKLFVGVDKLQLLCDTCHNKKTQDERRDRVVEPTEQAS